MHFKELTKKLRQPSPRTTARLDLESASGGSKGDWRHVFGSEGRRLSPRSFDGLFHDAILPLNVAKKFVYFVLDSLVRWIGAECSCGNKTNIVHNYGRVTTHSSDKFLCCMCADFGSLIHLRLL